MSSGRLEVLVEPFRENDPGPHVTAVLEVLAEAGLTVDMGPFSTSAEGPIEMLAAVVGDVCQAGVGAGATSIQIRLERT